MEKRTFVTLVMGVVGGLFFSIGMCMCLIPEWGRLFNQGVVLGIIGAVELLITWIVNRKMSGKKSAKPDAKLVGRVVYGIFSSMVFGVGMALVMAYEMLVLGIIVGVVGIVLLLCLIPMCIGLKDSSGQEA